ncbi:HET-domain-containing protein [Apiospora phragmitis]|uniref:HET-domain-containing protein n=1 Tax=Apiospora phragmitis TaxID=2905665 RepID=A0ABR1VXU8_9PEZI
MASELVTVKSQVVAHLKSWLQDCNKHHGDGCQVVPIAERSPHHIPDWVIDTEDACIVRGCSVPRYVALSYTWSTPLYIDPEPPAVGPQLMLLKDNIDDFCAKGFLRTGILDQAPVAVKDAIDLVQLSGIRYLWVDCLCIVQYDDTTSDRIGLMNEIYSGAYLTIIAAAGFARGAIQVNALQYNTEDKHSAASQHANLLVSYWASRGWKFQEQLLSIRAMIFLDNVYFWDCQREVNCPGSVTAAGTASQTAIRQDSGPQSGQYSLVKLQGMDMENSQRREWLPPVPDLKLYTELVCRYSDRNLTYDQDTLPAFYGVVETLAQSGFLGGFICGLPALLLDSALPWQPATKARQRSVRESAARLAPKAPLPSWSWVGCLLCDLVEGVGSRYDKRDFPSCTVEKLVDWSTFSNGRPINKPGLEQVYKSTWGPHKSEDLPPQWSYQPTYIEPVTSKSYLGSFVHKAMPRGFYR